jgi:hypothetical protein
MHLRALLLLKEKRDPSPGFEDNRQKKQGSNSMKAISAVAIHYFVDIEMTHSGYLPAIAHAGDGQNRYTAHPAFILSINTVLHGHSFQYYRITLLNTPEAQSGKIGESPVQPGAEASRFSG